MSKLLVHTEKGEVIECTPFTLEEKHFCDKCGKTLKKEEDKLTTFIGYDKNGVAVSRVTAVFCFDCIEALLGGKKCQR